MTDKVSLQMKLISLLLILSFLSCAKTKKESYTLPKNAIALIAGDSIKTWKIAKRYNNKIRMNMGDCFLSYRQAFRTNMTMNDTNDEHEDCGETLKATWEIVTNKEGDSFIKLKSDQIPKLMNIKNDYKYFHILHISQDSLVLQYKHKQFSNQEFVITDHYVTEHTVVKGRDFHNK